MIDYKTLIDAGVHFGHKKSRWDPKMAPYIWGVRSGTHLINVAKTAQCLEEAAKFLEDMASQGKTILWVGTKKPAQSFIAAAATKLGSPYVTNRWIGGTMTNFPQVKKSITKMLHLEDVIAKSAKSTESLYTKKEIVSLQKMVERLRKNVGSIAGISWPIGAVVIVDVKKEQTALREAAAMKIPVVGIVDTNSDPSLVDYVIPANDDLPRSIQLIIEYLAQAVERGKKIAIERPQEEVAVVEVGIDQEKARLLDEEDEGSDNQGSNDVTPVKKMKTKESAVKGRKIGTRSTRKKS